MEPTAEFHGEVEVLPAVKSRRPWPEGLKGRIVAETLEPVRRWSGSHRATTSIRIRYRTGVVWRGKGGWSVRPMSFCGCLVTGRFALHWRLSTRVARRAGPQARPGSYP